MGSELDILFLTWSEHVNACPTCRDWFGRTEVLCATGGRLHRRWHEHVIGRPVTYTYREAA